MLFFRAANKVGGAEAYSFAPSRRDRGTRNIVASDWLVSNIWRGSLEVYLEQCQGLCSFNFCGVPGVRWQLRLGEEELLRLGEEELL